MIPVDFRLILVDTNSDLCREWEKHFDGDVEIRNCPFQDVEEFDCIVTAANSFGLMDGGIDGAINRFFGGDLEARVQAYIIKNFCGEQPVGTSFILPTHNTDHPYLAHTPTMRSPMVIAGTDNTYDALRAALLAVREKNKEEKLIRTLLCPGLGTAIGQMAAAWRNFSTPPEKLNWAHANKIQRSVECDGYLHYFAEED